MTDTARPPDRPALRGLLRGVRRHCPNCDHGRLFRGYLKVEETCAACGHDNGRYRADDAGPYFTILLVGHLVIGPMLIFPFIWQAPVALVLGVTLPTILVITLLLLPVVKGAVIGVQWGMRVSRQKASSIKTNPTVPGGAAKRISNHASRLTDPWER